MARRELVDHQLRAERGQRVGGACRHDQRASPGLRRVRSHGHRGHEPQRERERQARGVPGRPRGSGPRNRGDSRDDRDHGEHVTCANALPEEARGERKQQDEPERQRRLDDGQGDVAQREEL